MALVLLSPAWAFGRKQVLPRVLVLGDIVYNQASREVAKQLKGKAEVVYGAWEHNEVADTTTALKVLDRLLGHVDKQGQPVPPAKRRKWDVIHFNFGLGDLVYRAPNVKSHRVMPIHAGGVRNTDPKRYEQNLPATPASLEAMPGPPESWKRRVSTNWSSA